MDWIENSLEWAQGHSGILWWAAASLAMCVLTPLAAAWVIVSLPPDYFASERRGKSVLWENRPVLRAIAVVAKNLAGAALIVAGLVMILGPGQGLLTIFVGLMLVNFPGKYRLQRWLATRPAVWRSITWLRKKARREPLQRPGPSA